jgi:hypothetical protein
MLDKCRGVFIKIRRPGNLWNLWNYFPNGKAMEYVHGAVDWVHGGKLTGLWAKGYPVFYSWF